jgi:hypothetical protein
MVTELHCTSAEVHCSSFPSLRFQMYPNNFLTQVLECGHVVFTGKQANGVSEDWFKPKLYMGPILRNSTGQLGWEIDHQ